MGRETVDALSPHLFREPKMTVTTSTYFNKIRVYHSKSDTYSTVDLINRSHDDSQSDAEICLFFHGPDHRKSALLVGQIISECEKRPLEIDDKAEKSNVDHS
jgi:hypothetical protein